MQRIALDLAKKTPQVCIRNEVGDKSLGKAGENT